MSTKRFMAYTLAIMGLWVVGCCFGDDVVDYIILFLATMLLFVAALLEKGDNMEMSLYHINEALERVINGGMIVDEETGEVIFDSEDIERLAIARDEKMEGCALWIKGKRSFIDELKREEKALKDRREAWEKRVDRMNEYVTSVLESQYDGKFETAKCRVSLRRSKSVDVYDEDVIPNRFFVQRINERISKAELSKALKNGEEIPGAVLKENVNLQIK